jgi:hypothetical protein
MYHEKLWIGLNKDIRGHWEGSCGPGSLGCLFPDGPFEDACIFHDFCYFVGGTYEDFIGVEKHFRADLIVAAKTSRFWLFWLFMAYTYSAHTRVWGYILRRWTRRLTPLSLEALLQTPEYAAAEGKAHGKNKH